MLDVSPSAFSSRVNVRRTSDSFMFGNWVCGLVGFCCIYVLTTSSGRSQF